MTQVLCHVYSNPASGDRVYSGIEKNGSEADLYTGGSMYYSDTTELVGNTSLLKLKRVIQGLKATVLAKLEFLNPGGSVKDPMAFYMLKQADKMSEKLGEDKIVVAILPDSGSRYLSKIFNDEQMKEKGFL